MKIELRRPQIVLAGAWNPAIFQPGWIARHLHQVPKGTEVRGQQIISPPINVVYINGIGISASPDRVEIYSNEDCQAALDLAEQVAIRILTTLPHTPINALGVNYHFVVDDPDDELLDKLKIKDGIYQHYKILGENLVSTIEIDQDSVLNFSRQPTSEMVEFDFNYHYGNISSDNAESILHGVLTNNITKSLEILKKLYDIEKYDGALKHDFNNNTEHL